MSIRLANFDHKASLSLREPHKLGWKLADHIPRDGLATELLVFEQFVYLHCNHRTLWTKVRADKQLLWFSCHLIARLRQSHDSDCHVSLCVWPLSWCPHLQPDTGTQTRHQYQSVTPLWWVSQAVMLVRVSPVQMETLLGRKREKSIWFLSLFYSMGSELVRWQELWTKYHKHISELITSNTFYWYLTLNQAT